MSEVLTEFIKESYKAGRTHSDIRAVLKESGWANDQISDALNRFVDRVYPVAIPKAIVFASPRLIFLNIFYFLTVYLSVWSVVDILFSFVNYYIPDVATVSSYRSYSYRTIGETIRWSLATIICTSPLVWWSSQTIRKAMKETRQRVPRIRLMLVYFTMFVGGCVMLGSATCFIYYFLSGELGVRFILKLLILAAVTFSIFAYYRVELKQSETEA